MGLGRPTSHYIFYGVIFECFSSAPWGGNGNGDVVQMAQGWWGSGIVQSEREVKEMLRAMVVEQK